MRRRPRRATAKSKTEFKTMAPVARALVHARLGYFNSYYGFAYKKVFIRNTRTRWGTCSALRNLSFNYRVVRLPPALLDYIVVHELCHLAHLNHSPQFWKQVARALPNWKTLRKELKKHRLS